MSKVLVDERRLPEECDAELEVAGRQQLKGDVAASNGAEQDVRPKEGVMLDLDQRGCGAC
ncbi:hypothetical protein [Bradyrhizobium liaoningense]|uniref:hypothetical protein n=1 Tax=Bradyrhizobium liaoningense TaxID=43992 RepID=UPI001BAB0719|nr:hypothetical protein [Bradyrhizobium liaoningense]MBR1025911.1 hypothetical protein [Bradyrhizobium liaoningense]